MILKLIRHGQSTANKVGIWQGQLDFPLSTEGVEQGKLLGKWLSKERIDALYSSDLERAIQTAEEIASYHPSLTIETTSLIRELNLGRFQGLTRKEAEEKYPEWMGMDWHQSNLEDVEQMEDLYARARAFIKEIRGRHEGKTVLAVTHGGFINGLLMDLLQIKWKGKRVFSIKNTSITTFDLTDPDHVIVLGVNETSHLPTY